MIAPIISGAMATHVGWRNWWWLNVGLLALSIIMVLFMFPETKWDRIHPDNMPDSGASSLKQDAGEVEKAGGLHRDTEISPAPEQTLEPVHTADRDPWLGRGGPSKQQWKLFQPNAHPFKSIALDLWLPWKLFAFPIVEFASFVVSWSCSSFLTLNLTQTQAFAAPPYLWSSQSIGSSATSPIFSPTNIPRLHQLRRPRRRNDRPLHGGPPLRLGLRSRHPPQRRYPRTRNASPCYDPLRHHHVHWQHHRVGRLPESLALGSDCPDRVHLCRDPGCGPTWDRVHVCSRQLQAGGGKSVCQYHGE
jgi:hypothetical protein